MRLYMYRYLPFISVFFLLIPLVSIGAETELSLDQSIEIALKHNPRIEVARQQCMQSKGRLTQAQSGYLPQVMVDGGYSRMRFDDLGPVEEDNAAFGGVSASQLIYDFGRTTGSIDASRYGVDAARQNFSRLLQNVAFDVKRNFYLVLEKKWLVDVASLSVSSYEQHADRAKEHFAVGMRTKIDVTNAMVSLSNARLDLVRAKSNLQTARVAFEEVLGRSPHGWQFTLISNEGPPQQFAVNKPPFDLSLETILASAMENHPSLQQVKALLKGAESAVSQAEGDYYPSFNAFAGYDTYETDLPNLWDQWRVGVGLNWKIFSGFHTRGKVAEASGRFRELQASQRGQQLAVKREATESYLRAKENGQSVDIAAETLDLATENLEVAEGRYKAGLSDVIEFDDAQFNFTRSQSNLLSAYYSYLTSLARVELATGVVPEVEALAEDVFSFCASTVSSEQ